MSRSILLPIAFLAVSLATAQTPDWSRCANVIPIPGNADGVTSCAVCNNGAQTYYPCDDPSLCYCNGTTIPPQYLLPFSPCSVVAAVRGNPDGLSNASCAVCDGGNYRWYPCEAASVGILCYCAVGSVLSSATTTAVPATSAPTTLAATTKTPTTRAPTTGTPTNASATTSAPTTTLVPTAAPTTTNASTTTTTTSTTGAPLTSTTTAATSAAPTTSTTTTTTTTTTTRAPTTAPTAVPTTTTACVEPSLGDPTNPSSPISVATRASPVYGQTTGPNVDRVKRLLNASFFASLFPLANLGLGLGQGPYTYDAFVAAIGHFPDLCNSVGPLRSGLSLDEVCRMELATMFAHFVQETGDFDDSLSIPIWKQGLYWYEELGCSVNTAGCDYTSADPNFPPVPGKKYYGRGPFQLSYNFNYGQFSLSVYGDKSVLLNHPEYVVSTDPNYSWLAFASALWFYMTPQPPKPSMHDVVTGYWLPSATDVAQGRTSSFAATIMIINGGQECGGGAPPLERGLAFQAFASVLQVQPSTVTAFSPVDCGNMVDFTDGGTTLPNMYWDQDWSANCACMLVEYYSGYYLVATANLSFGYAMCVNSLAGCSCPYPSSVAGGTTQPSTTSAVTSTIASGTSSPTSSPTPSTSAASTTPAPPTPTTTSSPATPAPPPQSVTWATCANVIAIPGNGASATDAQCAVCDNGAYAYWPCNDASLCYCNGTTIPPQYLLPFSNCANVVAVPGQNSATNAQCATCNYGANAYWPCQRANVGVLCQCGAATSPNGSSSPATPSTTACVEPSLGDPTNPSSAISVATRASPVYGQTTGPNVDRVKRLLNASFFASLFPVANLGQGIGQGGPYTYDAFIAAVGHFPDLCNSMGPQRSGLSLDEVCRMELATMFAHFVQETGDFDSSLSIPIWKQGLYWYEELGCSVNTAGCEYSQADPVFPPVAGKKYYGRGPFQLSYNYNYGPFSLSVYGDSSVLLNHPEYVVSTDPNYSWLAFASALWFYMTPQPPKPSMHDIVAGHWVPSATDIAQGRTSSFGSTIMVINGGVECGGGAPPRSRGVAFLGFSSALQVQASSVTAFSPVDCGQMDQFTTTDSTLPMMYWGQDWSTNCACMFVEWYSGYSLVATANLSVGYAMCVNSLPGCSCQFSSPSASPAANSPPAAAGALATLKGAAQGSNPTLQSPSRGRGTAVSIVAGVALAVGVAVAFVVGLYKGGWLTAKRRDAYAKPTEGIELPEVAEIPSSAVAAPNFAADVSCDA